jgi:hypothetical protein
MIKRFPLSITKEEFNRIKDKTLRFENRDKNFETKCAIKMFEPFFKMNEDKLDFNKFTETNTSFNFNILHEIPEFVGNIKNIKTDSNGDYYYFNENFKGKIKLPLRNWTYTLKKISENITFCYLSSSAKGDYIVMKNFITQF